VAFDWRIADPVIAIVIAALVIGSAWPLVRRPIEVLLEQAPPGVDVDEIGRALAAVDGVREVHDLHVWTITSGFPALSAHVRTRADADHARVLRLVQERVRPYGIDHTTFQLDRERPTLLTLHRPDCPEAPRRLDRPATETSHEGP
jgi:cobalt-zinc-cadmium efflux system protein